MLDLEPGAMVRLILGGTGRPVVGKAVLPAELAARDDWIYSFCHLIRKPTAAAGQAGEMGRGAGKTFVFKVEPDGSFRSEDIEAGDYEIQIIVHKRPTEGVGLGHEVLGLVRREVVVPEMPGGRSDEPLDLGAIPVTAVKKNPTAPGASKP
jgi:hypothetical protein